MYGINQFKNTPHQNFEPGKTSFYLSDHLKAKTVEIVGNFDGLKKKHISMKRGKKDWSVSLSLSPGKYIYKFLVDGKEMLDRVNLLKGCNSEFGNHSVIFIYNFKFELDDYNEAKKVFLAGNFNEWNNKGLELEKQGEIWSRSIYLPDGTYAYKYIVDGEWITDPSNPILRPDGSGNYNSYISIGETSSFKLYGHLDANEVKLAGNFNLWNYTELQMNKTPSGWELQYALSPGIYEYKFIVENEWLRDPNNPYTIEREEGTNSVVCIKPNHIFRLEGYDSANEVIVTGTFTEWNSRNYKMVKENGVWTFPIFLNHGTYLYRFIVDDDIMTDPANLHFEKAEFGKNCSVLKVQ